MFKKLLLALWVGVLQMFFGCRAVEPLEEEFGHVDECEVYPELCGNAGDGMDSATIDDSGQDADGTGGSSVGMPSLNLPFPVGEYWQVTQTYNASNDKGSSHQDYGGTYSDDRFAVDLAQSGCEAYGKPVNPMADGEVYLVEEDSGDGEDYGNTVIIRHQNSFYSRYAHMSEILVNEGDEVDTNDYIGKVGNTGYVVGTACEEHPGTHLHIAVYKDGEGVKPEPLSGNMDLTVSCWYDRLGDKSCSGDPGSYEDEEIDDEGELTVSYLSVNPEEGTAGETEFIWIAVVNSPDLVPEATLTIYNPNDKVKYEFDMETESVENPWTFTYRKTLRDAAVYTYWVEADNGDGNATSDIQELGVDEAVVSSLNVDSISWTPLEGTAGETEFTWESSITSAAKPSAELYIVNPNDATTYAFTMSVSGSKSSWTASYSKTLRDATTYTFWVVGSDGSTTSTSSVGTITVSDAVVESSGGGGDSGEVASEPEEEDRGESVLEKPETEDSAADTGESSGTFDTGSASSGDTGATETDSEESADTEESVEAEAETEESVDTEVLADTGEVVDTETADTSDSSEIEEVVDTGGVFEDTASSETGSVDSGEEDTGESSETSETTVYGDCTVTVPTDYGTIQDAIDASSDGDIVCVEAGEYWENLTIDFVDIYLVGLDGAASTIIDGGGVTHTIIIQNGSTATVDGFTIQDGNNWWGGGVYIYEASPTIRHCVITGNLPYGIAVWNSAAPTIENTLMVENIYRGLYVTNYATPVVVNSVLAGNLRDGMSVYTGSTVYLMNSIVYNNGDYGVAYGSSSASVVSSYNDVYGNSKGDYYGGASASSTDLAEDPLISDWALYTVDSASVCVDQGDPDSSYNDVDGSRNDMGAYGGPRGSW